MQIGSCRKQTTLQYSPFGPHKLAGQLCPTRLTKVRDFKLWNENKEVRHVVWSDGSLGMQLCIEMEFPSVSKSQKVCSAALCFKNVRACLPLGQQHKNANANAIETAVANKQLFSKAVLSHKPQLTGYICPARLTEVRDFRRLWNDNKEKSGMWSEVMGLWVCNSAWKWSFPRSQKVKRSVRQHCASKMSGHVSRLANKRETQIPNATRRVCGPFWLLDSQTTFEDSSPAFPRTIKEPGVPNGQSVLLVKPHKAAACDHARDQLSHQSNASSGIPSHLTRKGGGKKSSLRSLRKVDPALVFRQNSSCMLGPMTARILAPKEWEERHSNERGHVLLSTPFQWAFFGLRK